MTTNTNREEAIARIMAVSQQLADRALPRITAHNLEGTT